MVTTRLSVYIFRLKFGSMLVDEFVGVQRSLPA